jgi:hypothetical protein
MYCMVESSHVKSCETVPRCHDYRMRCSIEGATLLSRVMLRWLTLESQCAFTRRIRDVLEILFIVDLRTIP